jgi:hypothetical protein
MGPVQLVAFRFGPDAKFEGKVIAELDRLENVGTLRLLDLLFVGKDEESGDLLALDYQGEDLGGIVGALLGFEFEGDEQPESGGEEEPHAFGLSKADIEEIGASLEPGHSAALLLVEHVWATDFRDAVREAGGEAVAEGFLNPDAIAEVAPELAAMSEAVGALEAERASE